MNKRELNKILEDHQLWLQTDGAQGSRANLKGANLKGAVLKGAYLEGANLKGANLFLANLEGANLKGAVLKGAYLEGANLEGANLEGANLFLANLEGANLKGAVLKGAYLLYAYLEGADLKGANLEGAKLDHIHFRFSYNNKHELNAYNDEIRIGCKVMSSKEWLNSYEELGKANHYSEDEIKEYGVAIKDYINKRSKKWTLKGLLSFFLPL